MGIWNKSQRADPAEIARIQAQIDADPLVQQFRAGEGWARERGGRVSNPNQLSDYVRSRYQLPDGYAASNSGEVVYTNKTPFLQQAAWASLPFVGANAVGALAGAGGAAGGVPNLAGAAGLPGGAMYGAAAAAPAGASWIERAGRAADVITGRGGGNNGGNNGGGNSLLDTILRYLPLGVAGGSALMGLRNRTSPADPERQVPE